MISLKCEEYRKKEVLLVQTFLMLEFYNFSSLQTCQQQKIVIQYMSDQFVSCSLIKKWNC